MKSYENNFLGREPKVKLSRLLMTVIDKNPKELPLVHDLDYKTLGHKNFMIKNLRQLGILIVFGWLFVGAADARDHTPRENCFPFEKLSASERKQAEELLLKALDGESLYTLVGNLKPLSSGFASFQMRVALPRMEKAEAEKIIGELGAKKSEELSEDEKRRLNQAKQTTERDSIIEKVNLTRKILENWRCGDEIFADVEHFAREFDGKRFLDAVVFSRPNLRQMLSARKDFFSRWGITENSHPLEVLYAVEYEKTTVRNAGYGYLFGYPDTAVRFFVEAANEEDLTGKFVERGFLSIPTFARETNGFVYAVPKNYVEQEVDKNLRAPRRTNFDGL